MVLYFVAAGTKITIMAANLPGQDAGGKIRPAIEGKD
jgi:hypothetical protein